MISPKQEVNYEIKNFNMVTDNNLPTKKKLSLY